MQLATGACPQTWLLAAEPQEEIKILPRADPKTAQRPQAGSRRQTNFGLAIQDWIARPKFVCRLDPACGRWAVFGSARGRILISSCGSAARSQVWGHAPV